MEIIIEDYEDTRDIQHDLAMGLASGESIEGDDLNRAFYNELIKRGEKIPVNCKWVYDPYSYMNKKLQYDLA
jgi:hypothetical protein